MTNNILTDLYKLIKERQKLLPPKSYTSELFQQGENVITKKLGEEYTEMIMAAGQGTPESLTHEVADFLYHLLVLLALKNVDIEAVFKELQRRRSG